MSLTGSIKSADFKLEKHVPVIEILNRDNGFTIVNVNVGKEISHPNTTEHFIAYIDLFFKASDGKFIQHVGRYEFNAHGESSEGPNKGDLFTEPSALFKMKVSKPGMLTAVSYCNIHGLWESELAI